MKASVVDLRYRMKDVLRALDMGERVTVTHRGKVKGVIVPQREADGKKRMKMKDHPFFGMHRDDPRPVAEVVKELRQPRYRDL